MKPTTLEQLMIRSFCNGLFPRGWDPKYEFPVWVNTFGSGDLIGYNTTLKIFFKRYWSMDLADYWRYNRGAAVYRVIPVGEKGCKLVRMRKSDFLAIETPPVLLPYPQNL